MATGTSAPAAEKTNTDGRSSLTTKQHKRTSSLNQPKIYRQLSAYDNVSMALGHPVQVVIAQKDQSFDLDLEALEKILLNPRVCDKKVAVLSIAGSCRKGKSFLLNFFLKYLQARGAVDWLEDEDSPLNGFSWSVGVEKNTVGILLWSEPFFIVLPDGEKIALLLMDTQGSFECDSTTQQHAMIFALSIMLSSIQIFNILSNIEEDDLQQLELFAEYGRLAMKVSDATPFQHLAFVVRDWSFPYNYQYGSVGGEKLIEKRLQLNFGQDTEQHQLRENLRSCFNKISCVLLPHPGLQATTDQTFTGKLKDLDPGFKQQLFQLVPLLIGRENLVVKRVNGMEITGKELIEYFKMYFKVFETDEEMPKPKSMLHMTAEANHLAAVAVVKDRYSKVMEREFGFGVQRAELRSIQDHHEQLKADAMERFNAIPKIGGMQYTEAFSDFLDGELDDVFMNLAIQNESKNIASITLTPAVLFVTIVILYFVSGLLRLLWLGSVGIVLDVGSYSLMTQLAIWLLIRYNGKHADVMASIDEIALFIWERIYAPFWYKISYFGALEAAESKLNAPFNHKTPDPHLSRLKDIPAGQHRFSIYIPNQDLKDFVAESNVGSNDTVHRLRNSERRSIAVPDDYILQQLRENFNPEQEEDLNLDDFLNRFDVNRSFIHRPNQSRSDLSRFELSRSDLSQSARNPSELALNKTPVGSFSKLDQPDARVKKRARYSSLATDNKTNITAVLAEYKSKSAQRRQKYTPQGESKDSISSSLMGERLVRPKTLKKHIPIDSNVKVFFKNVFKKPESPEDVDNGHLQNDAPLDPPADPETIDGAAILEEPEEYSVDKDTALLENEITSNETVEEFEILDDDDESQISVESTHKDPDDPGKQMAVDDSTDSMDHAGSKKQKKDATHHSKTLSFLKKSPK